MQTGYITSIRLDRKFGFITSKGEETFFHMHALQGLEFTEQLIELEVVFETEPDPQGKPRAKWIRPAH
jgi:cold shock CspA family protein